MIRFRCPQCRLILRVSCEWEGKEGRCPNCGINFVIPKRKSGLSNLFRQFPTASPLPFTHALTKTPSSTTTSTFTHKNYHYPHNATQFISSAQERTCDIVIGFDFGTSCTKVVIRSPYEHAGNAYIVPFSQVCNLTNPYLLPSTLWVGPNGEFSLTQIKNGYFFRDIKIHLVNRKFLTPIKGDCPPISPNVLAVGYIALVLQEARQWFLQTHKASYGMLKLIWSVNVGIPSFSYDDKRLTETYRQVAKAGWQLSIHSSPPSMQMAENILHEFQQEYIGANETTIEVIPEVIAEAIGYAQSRRRNEGLHIILDIGASTVDMCSFLLRGDNGEDNYHILTADVQPLGTVSLYRMLIDALHKHDPHMADFLWANLNPLNPFFAVELPMEELSLRQAKEAHRKQYLKMLGRLVVDVKTKRDPRSEKWTTGVPVFLCGGGKMMPEFQDYLTDFIKEIQGLYGEKGKLFIQSLPFAQELHKTIAESDKDRLAVAWGLSYPEHNIGNVERPSEICDVPKRHEIERQEEPWER